MVHFVFSTLFTGSISDKALTEQGGFYKRLKDMKNGNLILDGDGIMADKGFTIHNEINELGLNLYIPPKRNHQTFFVIFCNLLSVCFSRIK